MGGFSQLLGFAEGGIGQYLTYKTAIATQKDRAEQSILAAQQRDAANRDLTRNVLVLGVVGIVGVMAVRKFG